MTLSKSEGRFSLVLCLFCLTILACGQAQVKPTDPDILKIANQCSLPLLKKNLYHLTSDEMEGRLMGSHGDTVASEFIADEFRKLDLIAPYSGSYFQAISTEEIKSEGNFNFAGKNYKHLKDGWKVFPALPLNIKDAEVLFLNLFSTTAITEYLSAHPANNRAIIVSASILREAMSDGTIDSIETDWKNKGVVGLIYSGKNVENNIKYFDEHSRIGQYKNSLLDSIFEPGGQNPDALPEIGVTLALMKTLLAGTNVKVNTDGSFLAGKIDGVRLRNKLNLSFNNTLFKSFAPNVIAVFKGRDTSLAPFIVSAHHDHDGKSRTGEIYRGAVDNASGTVAILEIARLLKIAADQGHKPKRSVVFASFTGEERGELGSSWYAEHPLHPMSKTHGILNIDMMGRVDTFYSGRRPDSSYAYFLVKDTAHKFREQLFAANKSLGELHLDTRYEDPRYMRRRLEGSDQFPFYVKGVPFIRIDCGFAKEYHQIGDTPEKINYELLTKQTKLAFVTMWNILDAD